MCRRYQSDDTHQRLKNLQNRACRVHEDILRPLDHFGILSNQSAHLPMVFVLGNHSSGKSTLINYLLHQKEQDTGVAPTDDGFTVIARSETHGDQDGPALMSDERWGFNELRKFGLVFTNHFRMKHRDLPKECLLPPDMILVDTPGMIDTPSAGGQRGEGRGYDFLKVVRWFAERADVILLLFDPNNPGTTGETLEVLTESLADLDHKFLLIMNKVDQFQQMHDFARAYGALCWNLAKVIPRKDLPRIYTMFTPTEADSPGQRQGEIFNVTASKEVLSAADTAVTSTTVDPRTIPLRDFNRTRDEVVGEILRAPSRRLDNIVTELEESTHRIAMSCNVANDLRAGFRKRRQQTMAMLTLTCGGSPLLAGGLMLAGLGLPSSLGMGALFGAVSGMGYWSSLTRQTEYKAHCMGSLDAIFSRLYYKELETDFELRNRWDRVRPKIEDALKHMDPSQIPKTKASRMSTLTRLTEVDIWEMRAEGNRLREIVGKRVASRQD